jgi:flagellar P-ring protein precursor FlgI
MLSTLVLILAPVFQEPGVPRTVVAPNELQAPEQPSARSSSRAGITPRFAAEPGKGAARVRARVGALVEVRGQEDNALVGVGLVTGLAGTGDSVNMTRQLLQNLLLSQNVKIDPTQLTPKNIALVRVEANLPAGIQPGRRIDVRVSTLGDAKSLQGGTLALAELTDLSGSMVYATAFGPVDVGGYLAEGAAASATKNHVTVGVVPGGGKVERGVPSRVVSDHGYIYLDARAAHGSFGNLVRISDSINEVYPSAAEVASDGRTVRVRVPADLPESVHVAYLQSILEREIEPDGVPRVVINERTGTIVMGEGVRLRPGAVAYGALTVTVAETPEASQPAPLSGGTTEVLPRTELDVSEENHALVAVPGAVTLQEVVEVLNVLGTTPRELIGVLEAMSQAGLVLAEIERM